MKVKVLKKKPGKIITKIIDTGQVVDYAPNFFEKRIKMGVFEIINPDKFQNKI